MKYRLTTINFKPYGEVLMDWKGIIREVRLLLLQLPPFRFLAVWLLAAIALIGVIYRGH
jgi:hypothetical protein